jgi:hypothetical protein
MNFAPWTTILFATVAIAASGNDIAGNWRAVVIGVVRPLTIAQATFEFKVEGSRLTGTARVGNDDRSYHSGAAAIYNEIRRDDS